MKYIDNFITISYLHFKAKFGDETLSLEDCVGEVIVDNSEIEIIKYT